MDGDEFERMLETLAAAWTAKDYETVAAYFAEDVFYSDPMRYTLRSREELLAFFLNDDGVDQICTFHNHIFDPKRQVGVAEYTYVGSHRYHGTVWIELAADKIVRWREYQHTSAKSWPEFWPA